MQTFAFILILLVAVIASQPLARIVRFVPLPVLQIAIGAALAWPVTGGVHVEIEPELFLLIFIPPLLFTDAWAAPKREFRELLRPILWLAFGLVFFTIVTFGFALHWLVPAVPLSVAFALAAVLSPTDAVAVSSIVDKSAMPPRLLHILEGESLLNDASGLVMFRFATAAALTGAFSLVDASASFIWAVAAGIAAGFAALFIANKSLKLLGKFDAIPPETQVLVVMLLPFVAYLTAEHWHASGVLAAVIAGLNLGRFGTFGNLGVSAKMLTTAITTMSSFVFNGAIFVLLGLQLPAIIRDVPPELTTQHWLIQPVLVVMALTLCLVALRYAWISLGGALVVAFRRWFKKERVFDNFRARLVGSLAGVRGAVTLAAVLSLPLAMPDGTPFPARDLAIFLAAGVILCWLALASVFLPRITKGFAGERENRREMEERRARISTAEAAIAKLEGVAADGGDNVANTTRQAVSAGLIASYRGRLAALEEGENIKPDARDAVRYEGELREIAVQAERDAARQILQRGEINDETLRKLLQEIVLSEALIVSRKKSA